MRQPVLLVAGCGDLGMRVARQGLKRGWQVYGLRRRTELLDSGIQPIAGDLTQAQMPSDWPSTEIDLVLYAVAAQQRDEAGYRDAYVMGLQHLLSWFATTGQRPKRVIFVSSTAVYGQSDGGWVDETSATEPQRFNGRVLLEAERWLAQQLPPSSSVRLAGLYGGDRQALLNKVRTGYRVLAEPAHFSNRIHVDDAADLLWHLLQCAEQGQTLQECYVGVDDQPVALAEVVDWLRAALNVQEAQEPVSVRGVESKRCSNARARSEGWQPRYPSYVEGYRERLERFTR